MALHEKAAGVISFEFPHETFFYLSHHIHYSDPITSLEIDPPHAVVIGKEVWSRITFLETILEVVFEDSSDF